MSSAVAFSLDIRQPWRETEELASTPNGLRCPSTSATVQATSVTVVESGLPWLAQAYKTLAKMRTLSQNWDSYGAPAPNAIAIEAARAVLSVLADTGFLPASIDPSAEGGVCIAFSRAKRYADLECFNTGEVLAVVSIGGDDTRVWPVRLDGLALIAACQEIRSFIEQ